MRERPVAYLLAPIRDGRADWANAATVNTAPLSPRRAAILRFIGEYQAAHGQIPTVREIADHVGLSQNPTTAVHYHLRALEEDGLLLHRRPQYTPRAFTVLAGRVIEREQTA